MKPMLSCSYLFLITMLISVPSGGSKKSLLCHHWAQFGSKKNMAADVQKTDKSLAEEVIFKDDGTYEESMYNGQLKITGNWYVNDDTTKMEFTLSTMNGKSMPAFPETTRHFNIIILKLSSDTLVYGHEFYIGKDSQHMVYDHWDLYFARKD